MWWRVRNRPMRYAVAYLLASVFSGIVTMFYYIFDHGLRDIHMTLLFLPPLLAALLFLFYAWRKIELYEPAANVFHGAFLFLWSYFLLGSIYRMAKTSSDWLFVYLIIFGIGLTASITLQIMYLVKKKKIEKHKEQ